MSQPRIQVLDCTLRDGGYINDWRFGRRTIAAVLDKLEQAGIDIIECGFLTRMVKEDGCSLFGGPDEIKGLLPKRERTSMIVAMIAIGEKELHPIELPPCDGKSISGIRLTFHRQEINQAVEWAGIIMDKGYKVFMQPVGTAFYSDIELLELVKKMNALQPYAFYIVDTLGSMYRGDVSHRFYLIDKNMAPEIRLGFHGHNNLQLAFSNAQVLGKIQTPRTLILDSSVYGMGRGAGNLPTELITQYINRSIAPRYDVTTVMDIYDGYIAAIRREYDWGYAVPYHIAASSVCHPNYASYLLNKQTLTMKDIKKIIESIPAEYRVLYDQKLIEELYVRFQSRKIDDSESVFTLSQMMAGKKLLLLAPGKSLLQHRGTVLSRIEKENPFVITINFADPLYRPNACFISNHKRLDTIGQELAAWKELPVILTSNLPAGIRDCLYVDYDSYTNGDEMISDNAGLMLLSLLKKCGVQHVMLAGFDGFRHSYGENYYSEDLDFGADQREAEEKQHRMRKKLQEFAHTTQLEFLTPSAYEWKNTAE